MIKTRFAPSPTGFLHIGGLRSALFEYLFVKSKDGKFLLRIEDTDRERFVEGGIENFISSLHWAGIEIDEGVDLDESGNIIQKGDNGPYIQSERLEIYKEHINKLLDAEKVYYCFCTKERLSELRKRQELNKQPTGYDKHCRDFTKEDVKKELANKTPYVIRLKIPLDGCTKFVDLVHDEICFENNLLEDQVLIKSDGYPTYHFAVVVDDHLMEITHIMRGQEWIPSTPKHVILYNYFGWESPKYIHLPLLVNEKKQKLSKRHGDVSVGDFKEKGYLPEAIVNFVAFLGWNPGDDREFFSLKQLEK